MQLIIAPLEELLFDLGLLEAIAQGDDEGEGRERGPAWAG